VTAAIPQRCRPTVPVEKEDDILAQEPKLPGPGLQHVERHHCVPEAAPDPLSARQHCGMSFPIDTAGTQTSDACGTEKQRKSRASHEKLHEICLINCGLATDGV
jgi:hypothetical protein